MQFKIPFTDFVLKVEAPQFGHTTPNRPFIPVGVDRDLSGYKLSYEGLFTTYRNQSDVFSCIREWSENTGAGGWKFINPKDKEAPVNPATEAEVTGIFNYWQSFRELKSLVMRDLGVTGNAFFAITRNQEGTQVIGLQHLDPRTMHIISDTEGNILKYVQRVGQKTVDFNPEEIEHFRLSRDPNHTLFGMSPMEPIIWEAKTDMAAMLANYFFFENDAQPAVQYILEPGMSKENQEAAAQNIKDQFKGVKNRNKSGVLNGVKEVKTFNISQKDMEFLQGRSFTTGKICSAYGVPKFMLGYTDEVNNNNGVELMKKFYESTIKPLEDNLTEVFNDFLDRIGVADRLKFEFLPQTFEEISALEDRCMKMYQGGAMTLRQLKLRLNMEVTPEDENEPNIDKYIIQQGASAVLLSDVGIDPMIQESNAANAETLANYVKSLQKNNGNKR